MGPVVFATALAWLDCEKQHVLKPIIAAINYTRSECNKSQGKLLSLWTEPAIIRGFNRLRLHLHLVAAAVPYLI